jgi:hypothetical protein
MIFDLVTRVAWPRHRTKSKIAHHKSSMNWHGVPVLPRSHRVLEAPLRKLAPAAFSSSCENWKMERPAGIAPASPEWRSGVLLLDDGRIKGAAQVYYSQAGLRRSRLKRTNTAVSSKSSHPQVVFTADLSVFEAHLLSRRHLIQVSTHKPLKLSIQNR